MYKDKIRGNGRKVEEKRSQHLSSFIHFTLEVVFIELLLKDRHSRETGNDTVAK